MWISTIRIAICSVLMTFARSQSLHNFRSFHLFSNKTSYKGSFGSAIYELQVLETIKRRICSYIECKNFKKGKFLGQDKTVVPVRRKNITLQNPEIQPLLSEPADLSNDTSCMKFRFPSKYFGDGRRLSGADLFVRIKKRNKKRAKSNRKRKIILKLSLLGNCANDRKLISRLKLRPATTRWYKLSLPVFAIRKLQKSEKKTLQLCLECKRCNKRTQITLPMKLRKKRKKGVNRRVRRRKPRKLRLNRPFVVCRTKEVLPKRSRRQLEHCQNDTNYQPCCRARDYISFSEIGLGNNIVYPDGFYRTRCQGSCNLPQGTGLAERRRQDMTCIATQTDPFRILVVTKRDVGVLNIDDGVVRQCSCLNSKR